MNQILIYEEIGPWGVTAKQVVEQVSALDGVEPVTVRVNSPGGDVYEGLAIMNALRGYAGEVIGIVEGLAASAASFIVAGGCSRVIARPSAELMVHDAWAWPDGDAAELRKVADDLDRMSDKLAGIYAEKAGGDPAVWRDTMRAETWYTAEEALAVGLVDAVEDARQAADLVTASASRSRVFAQARSKFKYRGRASAPPPTIDAQVGQKEDAVDSIKNLAQELGVDPDMLRKKLSGFFNEMVPVSGEVDVTYPAETAVAPTERVTVEPSIGDPSAAGGDGAGDPATPPQNAVGDPAALGLSFEMGTVPDGWDVTVDAASGVVTAVAPSGAEVGAVVDASVMVNGSTEVALTFKVRSLSDAGDQGETAPAAPDTTVPDPAAGSADQGVPAGYALVPQAVLDDLTARAKAGDSAFRAQAKAEREARVDKDIKDGRFSAGQRAKALATLEENPALYEKAWGGMPKNTIPRSEIGYGYDDSAQESSVPSIEALRNLSDSRMGKKNK